MYCLLKRQSLVFLLHHERVGLVLLVGQLRHVLDQLVHLVDCSKHLFHIPNLLIIVINVLRLSLDLFLLSVIREEVTEQHFCALE
jgi:hypothetical protein